MLAGQDVAGVGDHEGPGRDHQGEPLADATSPFRTRFGVEVIHGVLLWRVPVGGSPTLLVRGLVRFVAATGPSAGAGPEVVLGACTEVAHRDRSRRVRKVTWHRGLAWAAACSTGAVLCAAVWLIGPGPVAGAPAGPGGGGAPGSRARDRWLLVAQGRGTGVLGPLLVLPGLLAAVVLTLALVQDVTLTPPPGADYLTVASQGAWVLVYVVWPCRCCSSPTAGSPRAGPLAVRPDPPRRRGVHGDRGDGTRSVPAARRGDPHVLGTMPGALAPTLLVVSLPLLPVSLILLVIDLVRRYRASGPGDVASTDGCPWGPACCRSRSWAPGSATP